MTVRVCDYGGVVQSIEVPDRDGRLANVVLGFAELSGYLAADADPQPPGGTGSPYFGAIIGRYANRIANGRFTLDGAAYELPRNNGPNTLHGGPRAFNTRVWDAVAAAGADGVALRLAHTDADGRNGFPGTVSVLVTYTLTTDDALRIDYEATTDAATVLNLTNHSYFNLAGEGNGTVVDHTLAINADSYTPVDADLIPTGELAPVAGTPLDFTAPKPIGRDLDAAHPQLALAGGFDFNWVLRDGGGGPALAARAADPASGRTLTVHTTEPGVQFYSGNFLAGELVGPSGRPYPRHAGFALETQHYPNSPNEPAFPSTILRPGETLRSATVYAFATDTAPSAQS